MKFHQQLRSYLFQSFVERNYKNSSIDTFDILMSSIPEDIIKYKKLSSQHKLTTSRISHFLYRYKEEYNQVSRNNIIEDLYHTTKATSIGILKTTKDKKLKHSDTFGIKSDKEFILNSHMSQYILNEINKNESFFFIQNNIEQVVGITLNENNQYLLIYPIFNKKEYLFSIFTLINNQFMFEEIKPIFDFYTSFLLIDELFKKSNFKNNQLEKYINSEKQKIKEFSSFLIKHNLYSKDHFTAIFLRIQCSQAAVFLWKKKNEPHLIYFQKDNKESKLTKLKTIKISLQSENLENRLLQNIEDNTQNIIKHPHFFHAKFRNTHVTFIHDGKNWASNQECIEYCLNIFYQLYK